MLDKLARRGESIIISKQCDEWDRQKQKQVNIHRVGTTEESSTESEEEIDIHWIAKNKKTRQNQKQIGSGAAKEKTKKNLTIHEYLKHIGMSTQLCGQCFSTENHNMGKCYWKLCIFCKSGRHKSFICPKRPQTKNQLLQQLQIVKNRLINKKQGTTAEIKLTQTDGWTEEEEEEFLEEYTEVIGENYELENI